MKFPGSDWVHPWARPARRSQAVRLSAPAPKPPKPGWERIAEEIADAAAMREVLRRLREPWPGELDAARAPDDPDPLVFGPQYEKQALAWPAQRCGPCDVEWSLYGSPRCWVCRRVGEPP